MYAAQKKTFRNEEIFWVKNAGDPTDVSGRNGWPGASGCVLERSVIQYKPFVTAFSTGLGKYRFVNRKKGNTGLVSSGYAKYHADMALVDRK